MTTSDLGNFLDFLEDDSLSIPGIPSEKYPDGKTYVVPSPSAKVGARLAAVGDIAVKVGTGIEVSERDAAKLKLNDDEEDDLMTQVLGDTRDEMERDGVKWAHLRGVMKYVFIYYAIGKTEADRAARNGVLAGKEQEPTNRAERRQKQKTQQGRPASSGSSNRQGQRQNRRR